MNAAMAKVIPRNVQSKGIICVMYNSNRPIQLVKGPGKTGKNEPIIPSIRNTSPISIKKISIVYFVVLNAGFLWGTT